MKEIKTDIEFLITAFTYSFASLNQNFYLRKRDFKVIGVHIFDYSLISECKAEYNSGLTKEEERDIKEAIIANEKGYDTHIFIPRLTKEKRFEIITDFVGSTEKFKEKLEVNYQTLVYSTKNYGVEFHRKGIKVGVDMEYLTNGIEEESFKSKWTEFYRSRTKNIALKWLEHQVVEISKTKL